MTHSLTENGITFINLGIIDDFIYMWLSAYWKAFVVAFPTILFIVPYGDL